MAKVHKIAITGGPCGGKTQGIPALAKFLETKGWQIYTTPETATLLSSHGIELGSPDVAMKIAVQTAILKLQIALEDGMMAAAQASGKDCVILCDRGLMDTKVYIPSELWAPHLERHQLSEIVLRDRYDAVFHMVSAAAGAPEFYNHDNPERWETLEQAVINDRRTQDAWIGHSHLRIIDNSTGFEEKLQRLYKAVESFVSPDHKEIERRFLIEADNLKSFELNRTLLPAVTLTIGQAYLKTTDGTVARWRQSSQDGGVVYTHTAKSPKVGASCVEIEHRLTPAEFNALKFAEDTTRSVILKKRHCFLWNGKHMQLDEFQSPVKDMLILEVELDSENEQFDIPPFLNVIKEITTDPTYSNWNIATYGRSNVVETHQ